jgi:hypothetical protein
MNELYWITRFDAINTLLLIAMIFGWIAVAIFSIIYYTSNGQAIFEESREYKSRAKEFRGYANTCIKGLRYAIPLTLLNTVLFVFTPTTKEALLIYGVGGTIDYLKENPTTRQLPNKCIQALDKWVDTLGEDNDKGKKKEENIGKE